MEDVVNGVLTQLRYAPGRDVQIHLQDGIRQDASILYRSLMRRFLWRDFITLSQFTTDIATGHPVEDLSAAVSSFSDIAAVYKDSNETELPFAPALINPLRIRTATVVPVGGPHVFAIYPIHSAGPFTMWSRQISPADFDLDDTIPFYKDILVLGTAFTLCVKSGINAELTGHLKQQFESLVQMYRMDEVKQQYSTRPMDNFNVMTDWYVTEH
jgi:hypothetical protein